MTKESSGSSNQATATTAVQVALRIRPLTDRDRAQPRFANLSNDDVLKLFDKTVQVVPQNKLFTFDHVFGTTSTQDEIFTALGDNLIRKFIEGYNITILAYGQTSSGKTYTMGTAANGPGSSPLDEGIVPRSMALLFDLLHGQNNPIRPITPISSLSSSTSTSNKSSSRLRPKSRISNRSSHIPQVHNNSNTNPHKTKFTVKVSFIEIYNEDLHDLLNSAPVEELPPITIREDTKGRIYWTGVKEVVVHSTDDVLYYLEQGTQNRATGATDMNEKSSRSHAIFSVSLKQEKWIPSETHQQKKLARPTSSLSVRSSTTNTTTNSRLFNAASANTEEGEWLITTSKFHFVDLAGSERLKRTAAEGDRRKEGININAGLLALGNVISALGDPSKRNVHVPYRDSKLTRLLQDSLGGTATTLMIACASPVEYNLAETLNTLQYANRARNIKNRSEKNQVEEWMTTENIELLRSMIGKLKNELNYLKAHKGSSSSQEILDDDSTSSSTPSLGEDSYYEQRLLIADLQRQVEELDGEASFTRERNRMVEKELQRVRLLESMTAEQVDFQHLVEPVIEEYEKSVAKLESQLAMTKAALTHSDIGYEEQQTKLSQLEALVRQHDQTITELRLRLSKVLEREQNNEAYIQELESKLMKSAHETTKDQEMLNELKNRIMKLKETDENTEQYINNLEQRLAAGDAERTLLRTSVEELEAKIEAKERTNVELLKRLSKSTSDANTEKMILKELDQVNAKYTELEKERDTLQQQIELLKQENHRISTSESSSTNETSNGHNNALSLLEEQNQRRLSSSSSTSSSKKFRNNRKSLANENETASSVAAINLLQVEARLKEESDRANHLQKVLDRLQYDHGETVKELDEVLQRYHETLEQLDLMEPSSSSITNAAPSSLVDQSLDLSKEIAQAKEDAHEQEKQAFTNQIADLQHRVQSLTKKMAIKDSELEIANESIKNLEQEVAIATKQICVLKQLESEHNATAEVEHILDNLNVNEKHEAMITPIDENLKLQLANEKKQVSHWKSAHGELQHDIQKLTLDLDGKEKFITQLKEKLYDEDLRAQLEESNQQSTSLQKRLAETLASLTVLKIAHDGLLKKLEQERSIVQDSPLDELEKEHDREKSNLLEKHETELAQTRHDLETRLDQLNDELQEKMLDRHHALEKLSDLEQELQTQAAAAATLSSNNLLEQEKLMKVHETQIKTLTLEYETCSDELKTHITRLEQELDTFKTTYEKALKDHDMQIDQLTQQFEAASRQFIGQISELEQELQNAKSMHEQVLLEHDAEMMDLSKTFESATREMEEQISELESELESSKDLHQEILLSHAERITTTQQEERERSKAVLQSKLDTLKANQQETIHQLQIEHDQLCSTLQKQVEDLQLELQELKLAHTSQLCELETQHNKQVEAQLEALKTENKQALVEANNNNQDAEKIAFLESQLENDRVSFKQERDAAAVSAQAQVESLASQLQKERKQAQVVQHRLAELEGTAKRQQEEYEAKLNHFTTTHDDLSRQLALAKQPNKQQVIINDDDDVFSKKEISKLNNDSLYQDRIHQLEMQVEQFHEENVEYTTLSQELEKEIHRITLEKETLAEDLDISEDTVHQYQTRFEEMKSVLDVNQDDLVLKKIKEYIERSAIVSMNSANDTQDRSSGTMSKGSGAQGPIASIPQEQKEVDQLKKELHQYKTMIKDMITRDEMLKRVQDLEQEQNKQLQQEKLKLEQSEKANKKLEKQLEELLSKKSSFLCF